MNDRLTSRFAHLAVASADPETTSKFFEAAFGWKRIAHPDDPKAKTAWLELSPSQQIHFIEVAGFEASRFENEYGRHFALLHPASDYEALKERLRSGGAIVYPAERSTSFARFFFRGPEGYVFEVIAESLDST